MPLLSKQQFMAQRPGGDYQAYLRYVARRGGAGMSAAASAVLAGARPAAGVKPGSGSGSGGSGPRPPAAPPKAAGAPGSGGGSNPDDGDTDGLYNVWAAAERSGDEAGQVAAVNRLLGTNYATIAEAARALDLGYGFAGVEQWRRNLGGAPVTEAGDPALLNVSMGSAATDKSSFRRLFNYLFDVGPQKAREIVAARQALVPEWGQRAYDAVTGSGANWSTDFLGDPGINYRDPSKPLFEAGYHPASLWGVSGGQAGEEGWLRSLSAEQLLSEVFPTFWKSRNDPAFREANQGNVAFGSGPNSLYRQTPSYQTYAALGHPGDPTMQGWVSGLTGGGNWRYRPLTGEGGITPGGPVGHIAEALLNGGIRPEYFADPQSYWEMVRTTLGAGGAAAFTGDPSYWFRGAYEGANPAGLDSAYLQRLLALITGGQSGEVE